MSKTLDVTHTTDLLAKTSNSKIIGNPDIWHLLCKASNTEQGWMKSTKAMYIPNVGCVVQVTTQQDGNVSDALTFVPGAKIVASTNGGYALASA